MYAARRVSILGWVLTAFLGCAVGSTDGLEDDSKTRDAGMESAVEDDASDSHDDSSSGSGAEGGGGSGGDDGSGGQGGFGGNPGSGGTGGEETCSPPSPSGKCDPFAQCGCSPAQNCIFTGATDGETQCAPAGTTASFAACSSHSQCQVGHACIGGVCKPFCQSNADCAATNGSCNELYVNDNGTQVPIAFAKACSASCDLRSPQGVCSGQGVSCVPTDDGRTDCVGGFGSGVGAGACSGNQWQKCAPGYFCIGGSDCLKWCRVGAPGDCSGVQTCWELNPAVQVDGVSYGVCDYPW